MAEEYENYEARAAEAQRAVERWDAEGGAQDSENSSVQEPNVSDDHEQHVPPNGERTRSLA